MIGSFLALLALASYLLEPLDAVIAKNPRALWQVVEACVLNHNLTGKAFPCIEVHAERKSIDGFAVLRAPLERAHILVVPTTRIVGVEDSRLMAPAAPNFFEDAWEARRYVFDGAPNTLPRDEVGLAVNSRLGRTQNQLHIHVGCVNMNIRRALKFSSAKMPFNVWAAFRMNTDAPQWRLMKLRGDNLQTINVFKLVAGGLAIRPSELDRMMIAVIGASFPDGAKGFFVLGIAAETLSDDTSSEALLDNGCRE
jgi:CDP-diacylglycerol pyrophosphatase